MRIRRIDYTDWGEETMLDEFVVRDIDEMHLERTSESSAWIGIHGEKGRLDVHFIARANGSLEIWVETDPKHLRQEK